jgi:hypothetical protein
MPAAFPSAEEKSALVDKAALGRSDRAGFYPEERCV